MIETPDRLYAEHGAQLLVWARKFSRTHEDAEDSLQEAFLRIFRFWPPREPEHALTWAYAVVRNQCLDLRRKQKSRGIDKEVPIESLSFGARDLLLRAVSHEGAVLASVSIAEASRRLKPWERGCVAAMLQGSRVGDDNTLKVRLFRTRARLRKLMG